MLACTDSLQFPQLQANSIAIKQAAMMKRRLCCRIFFTCGNVLAAKRQFVFVVVVEKRIDKLCWSILFVQVALCTKHTHGNDEMSCTSISKEKVKTPGFFERLFGGKSSQTCDNNISRTSTSMSLPGKTSSHLHELREVTKSTTDYHAATPSSSTQSRQERRRSSVSGRRRDRSRGVCSASASLATTTDHSVEYPATPETITRVTVLVLSSTPTSWRCSRSSTSSSASSTAWP